MNEKMTNNTNRRFDANLDSLTNMLFSQMRTDTRLTDLGILKCPRCPDRLEALDLEYFVEDNVQYQRILWTCKGVSKGTCTYPIDMPHNVFWTKRTSEQEQAGFIPLPQIHLLPKRYHHLYPKFFSTKGSRALCLLGQERKRSSGNSGRHRKSAERSPDATNSEDSLEHPKRTSSHSSDTTCDTTSIIVDDDDDGLSNSAAAAAAAARDNNSPISGCATRASSDYPSSPLSTISQTSNGCFAEIASKLSTGELVAVSDSPLHVTASVSGEITSETVDDDDNDNDNRELPITTSEQQSTADVMNCTTTTDRKTISDEGFISTVSSCPNEYLTVISSNVTPTESQKPLTTTGDFAPTQSDSPPINRDVQQLCPQTDESLLETVQPSSACCTQQQQQQQIINVVDDDDDDEDDGVASTRNPKAAENDDGNDTGGEQCSNAGMLLESNDGDHHHLQQSSTLDTPATQITSVEDPNHHKILSESLPSSIIHPSVVSKLEDGSRNQAISASALASQTTHIDVDVASSNLVLAHDGETITTESDASNATQQYDEETCNGRAVPMRLVVIDEDVNEEQPDRVTKSAASNSDDMMNVPTSSSNLLDTVGSSTVPKQNHPMADQSSSSANHAPLVEAQAQSAGSSVAGTKRKRATNFDNDDDDDNGDKSGSTSSLSKHPIRSLKAFDEYFAKASTSGTGDSLAMDDEEYVSDFAKKCEQFLKKNKEKREEMIRGIGNSASSRRGEPSEFQPWMLMRAGMFDKNDWRKQVRLGCGTAWDAFVTNYNLLYNRDKYLNALGEEMHKQGIISHDATLTIKQQRMMEKVIRTWNENDGEEQLEQLKNSIDISALRGQLSHGAGTAEVLGIGGDDRDGQQITPSTSKVPDEDLNANTNTNNAIGEHELKVEAHVVQQNEETFKRLSVHNIAPSNSDEPSKAIQEDAEETLDEMIAVGDDNDEVTTTQRMDIKNVVKKTVKEYVEKYVNEMRHSAKKKAKTIKTPEHNESEHNDELTESVPQMTEERADSPDVGPSAAAFGEYDEDEYFFMDNNFDFNTY